MAIVRLQPLNGRHSIDSIVLSRARYKNDGRTLKMESERKETGSIESQQDKVLNGKNESATGPSSLCSMLTGSFVLMVKTFVA